MAPTGTGNANKIDATVIANLAGKHLSLGDPLAPQGKRSHRPSALERVLPADRCLQCLASARRAARVSPQASAPLQPPYQRFSAALSLHIDMNLISETRLKPVTCV
ncbi:hypothetical protein J6590_011064 [Homalodisca vitripennis]|nr:hypothetical protein J6590_011064 [Homalodisca vitripennis]